MRRLAAAQKSAAEERERFRDLEERLIRTELFADQAVASDSQAKEQLTQLQKALEVRAVSNLLLSALDIDYLVSFQ